MNKKFLVSTVSAMVLLLATPVLAEEIIPDMQNKPVTTPTLDFFGKTSSYEITQGTETDYGFTNLVADIEGNISKEYYKINLTGPKSVTWSDTGAHEISLNLPTSETPTIYKYSINPDADLGERIESGLTQDKVDGKLFANIQSDGKNQAGTSSEYYGGAIYNTLNNVNITSDFIGNSIVRTGENEIAHGGAIGNYGRKLGDITGNFIGNYAQGLSARGGAIANRSANIGNITGDFIGNYATSSGGAIYNYYGGISSITGDFIGNYATSSGGAILNNSCSGIDSIIGDFIGNHVLSQSSGATAGAIYNSSYVTIGSITGDFIGNYAKSESSSATAGAIYTISTETKIGDITGNFIANYAQGASASAGAIYNSSKSIKNITGNFIGNHAYAEKTSATAGAIYNLYNSINNITGDFIGNYAQGKTSATAGAIYTSAHSTNVVIDNITGNFIGNYAQSETSYALGGAIYNYAWNATMEIENLIGSTINGQQIAFKDNFAKATGTGKNAYAKGGAIYNYADRQAAASVKIGNIYGGFIGNSAQSESSYAQGGAIYNDVHAVAVTAKIGNIYGDFIDNYAQGSSYAQGGAIYNNGTIENIINSGFIGNHVSGNADSNGGAIYSTKDIKIIADNGLSEFTGNYVVADGVKTENAVYMASDAATLLLNATNSGKILFNDEIDGVSGYKINIDGDSSSQVLFNNSIFNADITLNNTNMIVDKAEYLGHNDNMTINSGNLTIKSGVMSINDLGSNTLHFKNFAMPGGLLRVASVTVDLENQVSGMITADTATGGDGKIVVENILLTTDGNEGSTPVQFVSTNISDEVTTDITEALAPIYKYGVAYDDKTGEFVFTRGDLVEIEPDEPEPKPEPDEPEPEPQPNPTPGGDDDDNSDDGEDNNKPSVPSTPIVRPAGYKAFNPGVFANDVAAMSGLNVQGDVVQNIFDMDTNREYCFGRVWATPYYSDDTLSFNDFYDVDSTNYGLIAGVDTRSFGNVDGWNSVYTIFGAYNDGENKYQGVKVDTKSWLVGLKASVFNGGFYGDALVNYAWHDSDQTTAFGKDSVDTEGYGAALKAGYKYDFANRVSVDGSVMLSWQQVEGKDFTSKSGARFDTDDYSRLSLVPQIKVGYSLDNIRPYALARYNFALSEDGSTTVNNNLSLPEIESKDYVEYGLGVETTTSFPHSGYAHVLRHDGGRSGWSVTAGYRYNF